MTEKTIPSLREILRQKGFQSALILIFNSLSWYFPLFFLFTDALNQLQLGYTQIILIFGFHYLAVAGSAFLGNHLAEKIGRNKLLAVWIVLGVFASAFLLFLSVSNLPVIYAVSILLGLSLGLGFPSCLAYFGENSSAQKKGLIGGIAFALTFLAITFVGFLSTIADLTISIIGFSLWRLVGLVLFYFSKTEESHIQTKIPYTKIIRERSFLLYFLPWVIFCVVNFIQTPFFDTQLQRQYMDNSLSYIISLGEFSVGAVSTLICGYLSDRFGRKRLIIAAFGMMGAGYALLSFASQNLLVFYSYVVLDGTAWGIFLLMFLLLIWEDLAQARTKNRYYLIGILPFIISTYISPIVRPFIGDIPLFSAFSLASFFLFLAVIPLMIAPETLPEKVMKDQDIKSYAEKALKAIKKANKNEKKTGTLNQENKENKKEVDQEDEYEKARKLAEKYY